MNLTNEFEPIRQWATDRGIIGKGNPLTQNTKLTEEHGELSKAILHDNKDEIADALGDMVVVMTSIAAQCGLKLEDCINGAYSVIKDRKGKLSQAGDFQKEC